MKKLIVILCVAIGFSTHSQNYRVVNTHLPSNYRTANGYEYAEYEFFAIDSVSAIGADTLFFTFATIRDTMEPSWHICLDSTGGSLMGRKILQQSNRAVFFNYRQDSIFIRTNSIQGEAWRYYTYDNGDYIEAMHDTTQSMEFLGINDQVKVIGFVRKDADGNEMDDVINEKNILLSKHYGLIQTFDNYMFPDEGFDYVLSGFNNPVTGLINLDAKGVYDFNIDDEFHFEYQDTFSAYDYEDSVVKIVSGIVGRKIRYVIDRVDYDDSVRYTYSECAKNIHYFEGYPDTNYVTETVSETIIFDSIRPGVLNAYPGQKIQNDAWEIKTYYDIGYYHNSRYNFLPQKVIIDDVFFKLDTCIEYSIFDPCCYSEYYIKSCGGPYFYWNDWGGQTDKNSLVYFNKSGNEWGEPVARDCEDLLSAIEEKPTEKTALIISPNPFSDYLFVSLEGKDQKIVFANLFDIEGVFLNRIQVLDFSFQLDTSVIPDGIYILEVQLEDGTTVRKKVIKSSN
jgi:hypothetical protein